MESGLGRVEKMDASAQHEPKSPDLADHPVANFAERFERLLDRKANLVHSHGHG